MAVLDGREWTLLTIKGPGVKNPDKYLPTNILYHETRLNNLEHIGTELYLYSNDWSKKFAITIDNNGTLSAREIEKEW